MSDPAVLFQGRRFRVERVVQVTADGVEHVREVVRHPGAVVILPLLDDGRLCFVRNYRVAVDQTLIELPAGTLEPGEDPAEARPARVGRRDRLSGGTHRASVDVLHVAGHSRRENAPLSWPRSCNPGQWRSMPAKTSSRCSCTWEQSLEMMRAGRNSRCQDAGRAAVLPRPCGYSPSNLAANSIPEPARLAAKHADRGERGQQDHRQHHGNIQPRSPLLPLRGIWR